MAETGSVSFFTITRYPVSLLIAEAYAKKTMLQVGFSEIDYSGIFAGFAYNIYHIISIKH